MPDFDVFFSLLNIKKCNKRSHGKRKNGNFKRKHKTVLSFIDLNILLNSGRHQMLSKLASLSVSSLRKFTDEANKFYDRKHDLYEAALLTRSYTQHALRPYIDSETNHIRHFIKSSFINKGIEFIDLPSIFRVIMFYQLYLHISKTRTLQLSVINITNLSVILYIISINSFLILILKLVPLILEIVKILNFVINQRVILSLVT